ncbi:hypothetical protein FDK12_01860 [Arthrobacter sp. NamB2]|uniref:DUF7847 domain-containing protein n=1 Tax=Arthrobacter sp. NamB2 TaxID=2576035 RepID=UPI0010C9C60A|nr:hypothetical protein [Arthrobacter sp. NamB2]TKV29687.1 hypothetical protein FDK12_01860 [Arthrobacter sp. NamB2]
MSDQVNGQPDDRATPDGELAGAAPWQSPGPQNPPINPYDTARPSRPAEFNPWEQPDRRPHEADPARPGDYFGSHGANQGPALPPGAIPPPPSGQQNQGWGWDSTYPPHGQGSGGFPGGGAFGAGPYGAGPYGAAPQYQAPPKPGVIPLRPLGLGEILDGAFQACRRNPLATFGIAVLLQAVVALVTVLLIGNVLSSFEVFEARNPTPDSIIGAFASLGVFASVAGVVSAVALLVLQGILVIPIARAVINQRTSFGQAWRLARPRFLSLLGFGLLSFVAGLVGLVLLVGISTLAILGLDEYSVVVILPLVIGAVVLMVWVTVKLVVAPAALMLEGTGPWTSVKRSWLLTRGNWWRTFGIVLLTSIIVSIIASVISTPLTFAVSLIFGFSSTSSTAPDALASLPILVATQAITALFTAIGYAFQAGVTSLLYVDLRIRREGFDVVLMREHEQAASGRTDVLPGGTASFGHRPDDVG